MPPLRTTLRPSRRASRNAANGHAAITNVVSDNNSSELGLASDEFFSGDDSTDVDFSNDEAIRIAVQRALYDNGTGLYSELRAEARGLYNRIMANPPDPPQHPALNNVADMTHDDLGDKLESASGWIVALIQPVRDNAAAEETLRKWCHPFNRSEPRQRVRDLPDWVLKNLLLDCWKDVRKLRAMQEAGQIDPGIEMAVE